MQKDVKEPRPEAEWQGSQKTAQLVRAQIAERWGEEEAEKYHPQKNCFTFNTWRAKGYRVKKGEKAIRSFTLVTGEGEDGEDGCVNRYPKNVCLFFYLQVEKQEEGK